MIGISLRTFLDRYFNGSLTVKKKLFYKIWKLMFPFTIHNIGIISCVRAYGHKVKYDTSAMHVFVCKINLISNKFFP